MTEEQTSFHPIGEQETTEDAEYREHDRGTETSGGEPAEASGSPYVDDDRGR